MPGRVDPTPARHVGQAAIRRQRAQAAGDVDRLTWVEPGHQGHQAAADMRVRRRVGRAAVEIGMLQRMRIDRRVPAFGEFGQGADMIEMTVRQQDCRGP